MSNVRIELGGRVAAAITKESRERGLSKQSFIELLLDVYEINEIDILIQQIRRKAINYEFNSMKYAQLSVLKVLLDNIV